MWKVFSDGSQQLWLLTFVLRVRSAASVTLISLDFYRHVSGLFCGFLTFLYVLLSWRTHQLSPPLRVLTVRRSDYINIHGNDWSDAVTFCNWDCQLLGKLQWLHQIARLSVTHRDWLNFHLHVSSCDTVKWWWDFTVRTYKTMRTFWSWHLWLITS